MPELPKAKQNKKKNDASDDSDSDTGKPKITGKVKPPPVKPKPLPTLGGNKPAASDKAALPSLKGGGKGKPKPPPKAPTKKKAAAPKKDALDSGSDDEWDKPVVRKPT